MGGEQPRGHVISGEQIVENSSKKGKVVKQQTVEILDEEPLNYYDDMI